MPPRQWRLFVADIVTAIEAIDGHTAGLTREQFLGDRLRFDDELLWGTVTDDLNPLQPVLAVLLAQQDDAG